MQDERIETTVADASAPATQDASMTKEEKTPFSARFKAWGKAFPKRYFIDAFSGMALGLFCTLIVGTIVGQIGTIINAGSTNVVGSLFVNIGLAAKMIMGAGIGVGIAYSFKAKKLTMFTAAAAGMIGANITNIFVMSGIHVWGAGEKAAIGIGDPVASYVAAVFAVEIANPVEGKTPVDIIVVPLCGIFVGAAAAIALGIPFGMLFALLGKGVAMAIGWEPISFGILIAVIMGLLLTLPTSSAAFGVMIFGSSLLNTPELQANAALAAGAACAGCCAHMVGFAVASFRENRWGGLISQGIGTSMLQIPNLAKNVKILLPAVAASIVAGPLASAAFGLRCDAIGSGMGTAGLVGVIETVSTSASAGLGGLRIFFGVAVCYFIVPAAVALGVSELMRHFNWIKKNDMLLPK